VLRRIAIIGGLAARQRRFGSIAIAARPIDRVSSSAALQALVEGAVLASYEGTSYKTSGQPATFLDRVEVRIPDADPAALERGRVLGEYPNAARELSNEPGNVLTPRAFAERATKVATHAGLDVEVLDETQIASLNMGLLLGVARGSEQPPRLIV